MKTMKNYIYKGCLFLGLGMILISCNDFLDKVPDNRTQIDSPEKVSSLLVTSYPNSNPSLVGELASDNMLDNRVPNESGVFKRENAYDRADTQLFQWEDIVGKPGTDDSPHGVWEAFYHSIASANLALEAIDKMEAEGETTNMDAQRGEALAIRAYCHFVLVNMFAMPFKDFEASKNDLGVTYMTLPEIMVEGNDYQRNSVAEVYELMIKDIEKAIPLIDDAVYKQPKYRFTKNAAHALAARIYLFTRNYDKVIEHADAVLGYGQPVLRSCWKKSYNDLEQQALAYFDVEEDANLLILATYSTQMRRFSAKRYGYIRESLIGQTRGKTPWSPWNQPTSNIPHFEGWTWFFTGSNDHSMVHPIAWEFFEYSDKIAGIGYCHILRAEFTTDMLLLERAEAKIFKNDFDGALKDLSYWGTSHKQTSELSEEKIIAFYVDEPTTNIPPYSFEFNNDKMSSLFTVTNEQKPYIDCVLHLRRMERFMQGDRWYDLRRYGIEFSKTVGVDARVITLKWDDPHRAIQIPADVINAGLTPNEREAISN